MSDANSNLVIDQIFRNDLIAAFAGGTKTKHRLAVALGQKYEVDTRTINQWLYRYEGTYFAKDRSPQDGLPTWSLINTPTARRQRSRSEVAPAECPIDIRNERWERLRTWQREAIIAWLKNDERGIVEAVTGAGKSDVGIALAEHYLNAGSRVIVLVPNNTLKAQWARRLREDVCDHLGIRVDEVSSTTSRAWRSARVIVATPITVARAIASGRLDPDTVGLLIADEAHHYGAKSWRFALSEDFGARLGLSATIDRADESYDDVLDPYFGGIIYTLDFQRAYGFELLAPFRLAYVGCEFDEDERESYDAATMRHKKARRDLLKLHPDLEGVEGSRFFAEVSRLAKSPDDRQVGYAAGALLKAITEQRSLRASCSGKLLALPKVLRVAKLRDRAIVFTDTIAAAQEAEDACNAIDVPAMQITAETPQLERGPILEAFRDGTVRVLIGPKTLDEGLDMPEADLGIVISASRSRRQMVQRFGRLLRKKADDRDAAIVVLYVIDTNEEPTHPSRDGFIEDLEDLSTPDCATFRADTDMRQLVAYLTP